MTKVPGTTPIVFSFVVFGAAIAIVAASQRRSAVAAPSQRQVKVEVPSCRRAVVRVGCGCGVAVLTQRSAVSFCPTLLHDLEQCGTQ